MQAAADEAAPRVDVEARLRGAQSSTGGGGSRVQVPQMRVHKSSASSHLGLASGAMMRAVKRSVAVLGRASMRSAAIRPMARMMSTEEYEFELKSPPEAHREI